MKLLALVLLLANLAAWFVPDMIPQVAYERSASGVLPRVSSLKVSAPGDQAPPARQCLRLAGSTPLRMPLNLRREWVSGFVSKNKSGSCRL